MLRLVFSLCVCVLCASCGSGGGSSSNASSVSALSTLDGAAFEFAVITGGGVLADSGGGLITFDTSTYTIDGTSGTVADSAGTYTYSHAGKVGTATLNDTVLLGTAVYVFTWNAESGGTYTGTAGADVQAGTFEETTALTH